MKASALRTVAPETRAGHAHTLPDRRPAATAQRQLQAALNARPGAQPGSFAGIATDTSAVVQRVIHRGETTSSKELGLKQSDWYKQLPDDEHRTWAEALHREATGYTKTTALAEIQHRIATSAVLPDAPTPAPNRRAALGYINPSHTSHIGLELLAEGAHTPYDENRWASEADWLHSPTRNFITHSPNSRTQDPDLTQGHGNVVFGHDEGASEHFNRKGHTQSPAENKQWNQQKKRYHGLEQRDKSNKSGGKAPRYVTPSQSQHSYPGYHDTRTPEFQDLFSKIFK
ncbi:hypothetical protein [Hymenobacter elongatus]|uniref:Uncharacterized protein n=1 Tax=Hymenobacter elongatus TaxID=877208 RepID=A0A4Z0PI73_9BACT|nr:hypothetical protein [Hymenobacter elongatus]TGE14003.1 hypothetical protein E5J99_17945 [Hymenobacter elongatus]